MSLRGISIRSPLRAISQRPLRNISKEMSFLWCLEDVSNTCQKRFLFCDVFKTSQKYLKKDVFFVKSLRRLEHISKKVSLTWRLWDVSKISLASIFGFSKIRHIKMISCDFRRFITISDEMDVGPSETLRKWNVLWEQCIDISQVCPVGWYLHESFGKSRNVNTQ